jgi:hypothetical protein
MVGGKTLDHLPDRFKQEPIQQLWPVKAQPVKLLRKGEDQVEVRHIQQFCFPCPDPLFFFMSLALGTMTVPATIVAKVQAMTGRIVTAVDMTTQSSSAAFAQGVQRSYLPAIGTIAG